MKKFPVYLLPALLLALVFTNCSDSSSNNNPVDGEYISTYSVDSILTSCISFLKAESWDNAVKCYDNAYIADNNDPKAIIYSTLAHLARISIDPKVASLMKDNFGFTTYPNKMNALFSRDWLVEYPEEIEYSYWDNNIERYVEWVDTNNWYNPKYYGIMQSGYYVAYSDYDYQTGRYTYQYNLISTTPRYRNVSLPGISTPAWVQGEGTLYEEMLINGTIFGADAWAISLLANLVNNNTNGFSKIMDDVVDGVFGDSFNKAVERLEQLKSRPDARISLDPYFIEQLDLEEHFTEYDQIGWAEANVLISAMYLMKSSLEWVQSYDLSIDLTSAKYAWRADGDEILDSLKKIGNANIPFTGNFLKARPGIMANSKASFIKAIEGLQASYTAIQTSDLYPKKVKESYAAINSGFTAMLSALNGNGKFYIPKDDPTTITAWPIADGSDVQGFIDFGTFFTEGFFSLQNIFEVEPDGKPVLYSCRESWDDESGGYCWCSEWDEDYYNCLQVQCDDPEPEFEKTKLDLANYSSILDGDCELCLVFKPEYVKGSVDINKVDYEELKYFPIPVQGKAAKVVFEKYYLP